MIQPEMMKQKIFCWLQFVGAPRRSEAGLHAASSRQECSKLAAMFLCTMIVHFSFNVVPTPFNQFNAVTANQKSVVHRHINTQSVVLSWETVGLVAAVKFIRHHI